MKVEKGGLYEEPKEKKTAIKDMTLDQLIGEREVMEKSIKDFMESNKETFSKGFKDTSVMHIPAKLFFQMTRHIETSSMQMNMLVGSMDEFVINMKRGVITVDLVNNKLRKDALEQICNSDLAGELEIVEEKTED